MAYDTPTSLGIRRPLPSEPAQIARLLGENADDTNAAIVALNDTYVELAGDTMTGPLIVSNGHTATLIHQALPITAKAATAAPSTYAVADSTHAETWMVISSDASWPLANGVVVTQQIGAPNLGRTLQWFFPREEASQNIYFRRSRQGVSTNSWPAWKVI